MTCATTLPSTCALVYTSPKLKSPVLVTPQTKAAATLAVKQGFFTPKIQGNSAPALPHMVTGVGSAYPRGWRQGFGLVTTPHAHPRPSQATVALVTPKGAKTMTTTPQGRTAPVLATSATTPQAHQLFADACNCAAMATWYTRRGNLTAATRKARQHLAALRQLAKLEGGAA